MYIGIPVLGHDESHHITVAFNGHGENKRAYLAAVAALAETCRWWYDNGNGRVYLNFGATAVFGDSCWHARVHSSNLERFRERLVQELDRLGVYHSEEFDFKPHVTLNYGTEPVMNPYQGLGQIVTEFAVESRNFGRTTIRV